jgi:hypothetical protein
MVRRDATETATTLRPKGETMSSEEWAERAKCRLEKKPTEFFYPERGGEDRAAAIIAYCAGCPVSEDCLRSGIGDLDGWFGGMSPEHRERWQRTGRRPIRHTKKWSRYNPVPSEEVARWVSLRDAGWKFRDIGDLVGVSPKTVTHRVKQAQGVL